MDMSGKKLALLILGSVGGLLLLVGLVLLLLGRSQAQETERLAAGPVVDSLTQLSQTPPGGAVMVQGKIAERNALLEQEFVAYVRDQYGGERCVTPTPTRDSYHGGTICEPIWTEDKRETPRLWLELSEGRVQLANTDYRLEKPSATWQSTPGLVKDQTVRYQGFKIGALVSTHGTVVMDGDTPTLRAEFIYGGDSQTYFDEQRSGTGILFLLGGIFAIVGAIVLGFMGVVAWVGRKKPAPDVTTDLQA
jgi:hypothetical protein